MRTRSGKGILLVYRGGTAGIIATVGNEATQLVREGFEVTLVLLGDPDCSKPHQTIEGVRIILPRLWARKLPKTGWAWAIKLVGWGPAPPCGGPPRWGRAPPYSLGVRLPTQGFAQGSNSHTSGGSRTAAVPAAPAGRMPALRSGPHFHSSSRRGEPT